MVLLVLRAYTECMTALQQANWYVRENPLMRFSTAFVLRNCRVADSEFSRQQFRMLGDERTKRNQEKVIVKRLEAMKSQNAWFSWC